eukprot:m.368364 g.368364  ORF g.368364 m.368364 type:complete len:308 (-) comp56100_c0_seq2:320-1243(-)
MQDKLQPQPPTSSQMAQPNRTRPQMSLTIPVRQDKMTALLDASGLALAIPDGFGSLQTFLSSPGPHLGSPSFFLRSQSPDNAMALAGMPSPLPSIGLFGSASPSTLMMTPAVAPGQPRTSIFDQQLLRHGHVAQLPEPLPAPLPAAPTSSRSAYTAPEPETSGTSEDDDSHSTATLGRVQTVVEKWSDEVLKMNTKQLSRFIATHRLTDEEAEQLKAERRRDQNRQYAKEARARRKVVRTNLKNPVDSVAHLEALYQSITSDIRKYARLRAEFVRVGGDEGDLADQSASWVLPPIATATSASMTKRP